MHTLDCQLNSLLHSQLSHPYSEKFCFIRKNFKTIHCPYRIAVSTVKSDRQLIIFDYRISGLYPAERKLQKSLLMKASLSMYSVCTVRSVCPTSSNKIQKIDTRGRKNSDDKIFKFSCYPAKLTKLGRKRCKVT
jgi:hypothetical protein